MKNSEGNIKHAKLYLRVLSLVNGPLEGPGLGLTRVP